MSGEFCPEREKFGDRLFGEGGECLGSHCSLYRVGDVDKLCNDMDAM